MEVDAKTDVYALSLCLIEAITGSVPFAGDSTVSTLAARVGKLMPVTADMGSLAAVLERAGRPEPEDRWTAAEFGAALVQAAGDAAAPGADPDDGDEPVRELGRPSAVRVARFRSERRFGRCAGGRPGCRGAATDAADVAADR